MRALNLVTALSILGLDQVTKWMVVTHLAPDAMVPIIPGLFSVVHVENRGIAFGLLAGVSSEIAFGLILAASLVVFVMVGRLLWKSDASAARFDAALSLILGGACGNLVDRFVRGRVVDFLDFYVGSHHWPAFNVADSAIVVGALILFLHLLEEHPRKDAVSHESR